jgi:ABC-2 type transport system permease protein
MSWRRIGALILRYTFLLRRSVPRQIEILFWPLMDLVVWGFLTIYLRKLNPDVPGAVTFLLGAMIFWDVLFRAQQGVTLSFLEDIWSRNLLNLFISPLSRLEFAVATSLVGLIKTAVIVTVLWIVALVFYGFNLGSVGFWIAPFFANLFLMGWAMGLFTTGLIVRWGQAAENLAWAIPFLVQPVSTVFYPLNVLPLWLQPVALCLPSTYVFEGMRAVLRGEAPPAGHLAIAFALNLVLLTACGIFFSRMFNQARERGLLAKIGTQ